MLCCVTGACAISVPLQNWQDPDSIAAVGKLFQLMENSLLMGALTGSNVSLSMMTLWHLQTQLF